MPSPHIATSEDTMAEEQSDQEQPDKAEQALPVDPERQKYQAYLDRKSKPRVKDMPKDVQKERYRALTGLEPTDADLEMALDLNLL